MCRGTIDEIHKSTPGTFPAFLFARIRCNPRRIVYGGFTMSDIHRLTLVVFFIILKPHLTAFHLVLAAPVLVLLTGFHRFHCKYLIVFWGTFPYDGQGMNGNRRRQTRTIGRTTK